MKYIELFILNKNLKVLRLSYSKMIGDSYFELEKQPEK